MIAAICDNNGIYGKDTNEILLKRFIGTLSEREVDLFVIKEELFNARVAKYCKQIATERDLAVLPLVEKLLDKHKLYFLLEPMQTVSGIVVENKFYEVVTK
jgi:hypothetical protein